jgi:anti-anti-sigma factor
VPPFIVEPQRQDETIRLVVRGELDMETGPRLREELERARAAQAAVVILDLREVTFFDSTGLQIVLDAEVHARENGGRLVVLPGDGEPRRVLELAGVTDRLRLQE